MNRVFAWLRDYHKRNSDYRYRMLLRKMELNITTEQKFRRDAQSIGSYWKSVGDDIRKAIRQYEDENNGNENL